MLGLPHALVVFTSNLLVISVSKHMWAVSGWYVRSFMCVSLLHCINPLIFIFFGSLTVLCRQCKGQGSCDVSVPGQCVQYYRCQKVENNWYVEKMNCAHGTHFSEATGGCIQPKDANCPYGNSSSICAYCFHFTNLIALEIN